MTTGYSTTLRNAQLDAITTAVGNAGKLAIYDGTRPATGGAATTKLAEFTLGTPFAAAMFVEELLVEYRKISVQMDKYRRAAILLLLA